MAENKDKKQEGNTLGAGAHMEAPEPVRGNTELNVLPNDVPEDPFQLDLSQEYEEDEFSYSNILPFGEDDPFDESFITGDDTKTAPLKSSIGSHIFEGLGFNALDDSVAETFKELQVIKSDIFEQNIKQEEDFNIKLESVKDDLSADEFVAEFKDRLFKDPTPRSIGTIYTEKVFPSLPPLVKDAVATGIDIRLSNNRNNDVMANLMEFDTLLEASEFALGIDVKIPQTILDEIEKVDKERKNSYVPIPGAIFKIDTYSGRPFSTERLKQTGERINISIAKDVLRKDKQRKEDIEKYGYVLGSIVNSGQDLVETLGTVAHMPTRVLEAYSGRNGRVNTLGDWFHWISLVPDNPEREVDYGRIWEAWMEGTDPGALTEEMSSRYGDDWEWRFVGFLLKEIGFDAALYASGQLFPAVAELMTAKVAGFWANSAIRAKHIFARASLVGVGGGLLQAGMDKSGGAEGDLSFEVLVRFGGFALGEVALGGLAAGVGTGVRGIRAKLADNAQKAAEELQVARLSPRALKEAKKIAPDTPELVTLFRTASIFRDTAEIRRTAGFVARSIVRELRKEHNAALRKQLTDITGLRDQELETHVVAAHHIFGQVHRKQDLESAEQLVKVARKAVETLQKDRESISKEIRRLKKLKDRARLKETRAKHTAAIKEQQSQLANVIGSIERDTAALEGQEAIVSRLQDLGLSSGSELADMIATGEAVGLRVLVEDVMETNQQAVNNLLLANIDWFNGLNFRNPNVVLNVKGNIDKALSTGARDLSFNIIGEPDHVLPVTSVAEDFFDTWNYTNRFKKLMQKMYSQAVRNTTSGEREKIFDMLERGQQLKKIFTYDELSNYENMSNKAIDAYFSIRKVLDIAHLSLDTAYTRNLQSKILTSGKSQFQVLPDGRLVEIGDTIQKGLTKEQIEQGYVKFRVVPRSNADVIEEGFVKHTELRPLVSAIPVERGYIPRAYRDADYHVSQIDLKTGKMNRLHTARTWDEAEARRFELEKLAEKNGEGDTSIFFADKWNSVASRTTVAFPKKGVRLVDGLDEASGQQFRNALVGRQEELQEALRAGTASESELIRLDQIRFFIENLDATALRGRHISPRGKRLTKASKPSEKADLAMTEDSIRDYLSHTAMAAGNTNWREHAIDKFMSIYGEGGPKQVFRAGQNWNDKLDLQKINRTGGNNVTQHFLEAVQMQGWLRRHITGTTWDERAFNNMWSAAINKMKRADSPAMAAVGRALDNWLPEYKTFINSSRFTVAYAKLLMFGPAQLIVQGSQTWATIASRLFTVPHLIPLAVGDMLSAIGARVAETSGSKVSNAALAAARRSGYIADLTTNDFVELMGVKAPSLNRYRKYYQDLSVAMPELRAASAKLVDTASGVHRTFYTYGASFFKAGEGINRLMAFFMTRREYISLAKRGKLSGLDGNKFKGQVDDTEFLQLVSQKAKETALNMAKPGELQAFSGIGSVLFQFKQVLPKAGHMMFTTKNLSGREKLGAIVGMVGLWGPTSIPFLYDFVNLSEAAWAKISKNPTETEIISLVAREKATEVLDWISASDDFFFEEMGISRKFISRLVRKGSLNALTDGEIDIVNRIGFGKFISEFAETAHWEDAIVVASVASDIWRSFINGKEGSPSIWTVLDRYNRHELTLDQAKVQALGAAGRTFSSMGGFARYFEASDPATYDPLYHPRAFGTEATLYSSSGRNTGILARDPTRGEIFGVNLGNNRLVQHLIGITPGPVVNEIQMRRRRNEYNRAIFQYIEHMSYQYRTSRTLQAKEKIMAEALTELYDTQQLVMRLGFEDLAILKQKNWIHRQIFGKFLTDEMRFFNPTVFGEE